MTPIPNPGFVSYEILLSYSLTLGWGMISLHQGGEMGETSHSVFCSQARETALHPPLFRENVSASQPVERTAGVGDGERSKAPVPM